MEFLGADTEQLRDHAETTSTGRRDIEDLLMSLAQVVLSVNWVGSDADRFKNDWQQTHDQARDILDQLEQRRVELDEHADEQDQASEGDGGAVAGGNGPFVPVLGEESEFEAVLGEEGPDASEELGESEMENAKYTNPADDGTMRDPDADNSNKEHTYKYKDEDGNEYEVKLDENGEGTLELDGETKNKIEITDGDGNKLTIDQSIDQEVKVKVNDDGSVTYTFSTEATSGANAELDGGSVGVEGGHSTSEKSTYEVTVPAGTSPQDAAKINPYDPASIPEGASITIGHDSSSTASGGAEATLLGVTYGVSAEKTEGQANNTVISRQDDGTLSITTGPEEYVNSETRGSIGVDKVFEFEGGTGTENSIKHLDHVEFSNDAAGNAAYQEAMRSGDMPTDTSTPGVIDRYTDTHYSNVQTGSAKLDIAGLYEASGSHENYSNHTVVREYPDGHQEYAQIIDVHGDSSNDHVLITGGSDRDNEYQLHYNDLRNDVYVGAEDGSNERHYSAGSDVTVTLSEDEITQMMKHRENEKGNVSTYGDNPAEYAAGMVAMGENRSDEEALQTLYNNHNYDFEGPALPEGGPRGNRVHDDKFPGNWDENK